MATKSATAGKTTKTTELLVITGNELGAFARMTTPLAKNRINIECFSGYEWSGEAAFRIVTDNNRKASELLRREGFNVQENPVVLWTTENTPGQLDSATVALAEAKVNTYSSYSTNTPGSTTTTVAFGTNDADRASDILRRVR
ncbi:MAG TPA: hypothetical protein PLZ86_01805 [bacterium]|nr:hypothetical protein [bacterium]